MRQALAMVAVLTLFVAACGRDDAAPPGTTPASPPASAPQAGSPAATSGATGSETAPPAGALTLDSIVTPTVDLNVREEPGTGANRLGSIAAGSDSFLVDGPREADGYTWYLVSALGIPPASGCVTPIETDPFNCPMWFGWVAAASPEGVPWLTTGEVECPIEAPYDAREFNIGKPPLHLLYCYEGDTLILRAWLPPQEPRSCPGQDAVPWLACPEVTLGWSQDYPYGLAVAIDPARPVTLPAAEQWVEISAHMDHPASTDCRPFPEQPAGQAAVFCRAILILDSIAPTAAP